MWLEVRGVWGGRRKDGASNVLWSLAFPVANEKLFEILKWRSI